MGQVPGLICSRCGLLDGAHKSECPDRPRTIRRADKPVREVDIQAAIRAALSKMPDVAIYRNNVGKLQDRFGATVAYGLGVGTADLIGSLTMSVRERVTDVHVDSVNRKFARSLAIEVKRPGERPTDDQRRWQDHVRAHGWLVGTCHSVDEAVALIDRGRRWEE